MTCPTLFAQSLTFLSSGLEGLILSYDSGFSVTCGCNEEEINDDDDGRVYVGVTNGVFSAHVGAKMGYIPPGEVRTLGPPSELSRHL